MAKPQKNCHGFGNLGRLKRSVCNILAYNGGMSARVDDTFVILNGHNDAGGVEYPQYFLIKVANWAQKDS